MSRPETGVLPAPEGPTTTAPPATAPSGGTRRRRAPKFILAAPAGLWFALFFIAPVALVAWYSLGFKPGLFGFHDNSILSLDRYREVIDGPFLETFKNTLFIAVTGTVLCLVIALPFTYFLAVKAGPRSRNILLALVMVPFWTNFLVRTLGWRLILAPDGNLSGLLQQLHLTGGPLDVLDTRLAVQIGVVYNYLPLMILPLWVALDRLDPALREASKDLGANRLRTMLQVTLPLAMPGIATGALLVFVPLMGDYITASVLGGAKGNMVGLLVASQFQEASNWALGSAAAMLLIVAILASTAIAAAVALVIRWLLRRRRVVTLVPARPFQSAPAGRAVPPVSSPAGHERRTRVIGRILDVGLRVWAVAVYVFLYAPIAYIVVYSFNRGRLFASWDGFGLNGYQDALSLPQVRSAVIVSLQAGVGTAVVATVLGTCAGIALARRSGRWSTPFTVLLALVLVTPEIMLAISELPWFVSLGTDHNLSVFNNGLVRLVIAHSLFATAVVTFIVRARMSGLDESLEEAAADLYAPPSRRFYQVTLPLMMPAIIAGAMLSFTFSLDDTILSTFVSVQGNTPWPVYIFSSVRSGLRPFIASMSTIMLLLTLVVLGTTALVLRRGGGSGSDVAQTMTGTG